MIEIIDLEKSYKDKKILKKINFKFIKGEINCIVGRNGAGKSTLLKCILGSLDYDKGSIYFEEQINKYNISYLAEERGLYKDSNVFEQISYFANISKIPKYKEKVENVINDFELGKYAFTKIKKLSKGNSQKVQLACVFVSNPKLLILDEPFSGLDLINQKKITKIIKKYSENRTIIISTHQGDFLDNFCENILVLREGKNVLSGKVKEITSKVGKEIEIKTKNNKKVVYKYTNDYNFIKLIEENKDFLEVSVKFPKITKIIEEKMEE